LRSHTIRPVQTALSEFTSADFTGLLRDHGIASYLHGYDSVSAATAGIGRYLTLYNTRRPHSSLTDRTPDEAYFFPLPIPLRLSAAA
jgi:transposase InsO family protein